MVAYEYVVWIQRTDSHDWFELCRCESVDAITFVILAILTRSKAPPRYIRVESVEAVG